MSEVWPLVHAERRALIEFLDTLGDEDWETPSLCRGWSVHDVVAHLVDAASTTRTAFVLGLALARFDVDRQNRRGVVRERRDWPEQTLERLRAVTGRTSTPPARLDTRLVEAVVHGEDIRRPLGAAHIYAPEAVERALRLQVRTSISFGGGRERLDDLALHATDSDFISGEGTEVRGSTLALLMAVSGRRAYLSDLEGPGTAQLGEWV